MGSALVTGGGKRLGREIAISLAKKGYNLAIHYNSSDKEAEEVKDICIGLGVRAETYQFDLKDYRESETFIDKIYQDFKDLEVLVNCASVFIRSHTKDTNIDTYENNMDINFSSPYFLAKGFAKSVDGGVIINLLDTKIGFYHDAYSSYSLSKKMLGEFTKLAALEFAPKIRVNGVAPGTILPPNGVDEEYMDRLINKVPLKRMGDPKDIVRTVEFLLDSDFITGEIIFVDGGENIKGY
jgi:NAD(P)-dependent dehydrogenase (short-subunit alcohol dehydrogenase family)